MNRRWICHWHTLVFIPYKPWFLRRLIMRLFNESWEGLVNIETAIVYISEINNTSQDLYDKLVWGSPVWAEYIDTKGHYNVIEAVIDGKNEDDAFSIRFAKPISEPDTNENVYIKLSL